MYIWADSPTRSLRTALHDGEELLLVGGNGHPVGRHSTNPSELIIDLTDWTRRWFEGAECTHLWSAQDYEAHGGVPFVGKLPRGGGHVYLATGYSKVGHDEFSCGRAANQWGNLGQRAALGAHVGDPSE
jgi:hypothetical protein